MMEVGVDWVGRCGWRACVPVMFGKYIVSGSLPAGLKIPSKASIIASPASCPP